MVVVMVVKVMTVVIVVTVVVQHPNVPSEVAPVSSEQVPEEYTRSKRLAHHWKQLGEWAHWIVR